MPYENSATRTHPACIVFLVDQSYSMNEEFAGDQTKTKRDGLTEAINRLLLNLVVLCDKDPGSLPRHYYDIGVVGYGTQVGSAFGGALQGRDLVSIPDLARHPLDPNEAKWIHPVADGRTPMGAAMDKAGQIIAPWISQHPDSFPPIVINVSDGAATDDPETWADRLKALGTRDGSLLLFNLNLSWRAENQILYPNAEQGLPDEFAIRLFRMSSALTPKMCQTARVQSGARGFGFNADFDSLVSFLQTGTQIGGLNDSPTVSRSPSTSMGGPSADRPTTR